jgi:hypothetical protein
MMTFFLKLRLVWLASGSRASSNWLVIANELKFWLGSARRRSAPEAGHPGLRQHLETRRPLEQLDAALFRAYKLVRSCAQQQKNTSQLYQMFTGADVAAKLRLAQEEIDRYINLIPMITLVAAVGARQVDLFPLQCLHTSYGVYVKKVFKKFPPLTGYQ